MSTLINRVQRALLGSAGPEKVKALLAELQIPAGGSGGSIREVRRGVLRPISDEAILRDALAAMGVSGGGGGGQQALADIRTAVLHNVVDPETQLLAGLDDLLEPGDLAGEGPWVPDGAKIHIDFLGGSPQGRAWVDGAGEVAVTALLGNDPDADSGFGGDPTEYDPAYLTADGYVAPTNTAYLGVALTMLLAGATVRVVSKKLGGTGNFQSCVVFAADGNDAVTLGQGGHSISASSWAGSLNVNLDNVLSETNGSVNVVAFTETVTRMEIAANGNASIATGTVGASDRPPGNPFVAAVFSNNSVNAAIQSITIYDPLPDTTGLSDLSEL